MLLIPAVLDGETRPFAAVSMDRVSNLLARVLCTLSLKKTCRSLLWALARHTVLLTIKLTGRHLGTDRLCGACLALATVACSTSVRGLG